MPRQPAPMVSCLCPTYGRPVLLAEAAESFLRQDYGGPMELVVLNDCAAQELRVRGARTVNSPRRFGSLGAKYNALVAIALGNVLMPWEDDDISLPHRVSQAVEALGSCGYWNPQVLLYYPRGGKPVRDSRAVCHSASAFTREAWLRAGCYPDTSVGQDAAMDAALKRTAAAAPAGSGPPAYVYRWGVTYHLSAGEYEGLSCGPAGLVEVEPCWRDDYAALCASSLR